MSEILRRRMLLANGQEVDSYFNTYQIPAQSSSVTNLVTIDFPVSITPTNITGFYAWVDSLSSTSGSAKQYALMRGTGSNASSVCLVTAFNYSGVAITTSGINTYDAAATYVPSGSMWYGLRNISGGITVNLKAVGTSTIRAQLTASNTSYRSFMWSSSAICKWNYIYW